MKTHNKHCLDTNNKRANNIPFQCFCISEVLTKNITKDTSIEEPTEEEMVKNAKELFGNDFIKDSLIAQEKAFSPKDTCEEEWADRVLTAVIYNELEDYDENRKSGWKINSDKVVELIRSLIAEKEATAREEERKRMQDTITAILKKYEQENDSYRPFSWLRQDIRNLLLALKTN